MLEPKQLTLQQQQALALAQAKRKRAQAQGAAQPSAQPNVTPMGGVGEFDPKAFAGLNVVQSRASTENPIVAAQRASQVQTGNAFAAQKAEEQRRAAERRKAAAVNMGDFILSEDAGGNIAPNLDVEGDIAKTVVGSPIQFGQGLAEGTANFINNATNIGAEGLNAANKLLLGDKAYKFTGTNIQVPQNVIVDQGGPLQSVSGMAPRIAGQIMSTRVPLGKVMPGGGVGAEIAKDALSYAAATDKDTQRLSDMLPAGTPLDFLRSREGESYAEAFAKNALEDAGLSAAATALLKGGGKVLDSVGNQPMTPTNAGGANLGSRRPMPPQTPANALASPPAPAQAASAGQPSVVPQPTVSQAGTAGTGQQAGAAQPVLNAVPASPAPISKAQAREAKDTAVILGRIMRAGNIKNDAVRGYLPGLIQRYESLGDSRIPLARFIERDLPQHFPERVAGDVIEKLRGFGRERDASTGPKDTSRYTMQETKKSLRGSQQDHLTEVIKSNTYRKDLIDAEDKIKADMRLNAEAGYETALTNGIDRFAKGRVTADEAAEWQSLELLMKSEPFLSRIPDHVQVQSLRQGKTLAQKIEEDPFRTAHWLQSALGKAERAAEGLGGSATPESLLYKELRAAVLEPLEKVVPGYKGARQVHGDLFGADEAVDFGEDLFTVAKSEAETARKARNFRKLSKQQQTVATMSLRDKLLNEFRGTPEDAAAKLTRLQQEGALDAVERILGADGKRITAAIRETVEENEWLRSIDQGSGSPTFSNLSGAAAAAENVRGPVNKAVGSLGDKRTYVGAALGDALLMGVGVPPILTVGKATSDIVGAVGKPSPRQLSNATKGLFGLPDNVPTAPPAAPGNKLRAPRKPRPTKQALEADLESLLKQYDAVDHRNNPTESARVLKQIQALQKRIASSKAPAAPPAKRPLPGETSNSPAALGGAIGGGILTGGATYAATGDEDLALRAGAVGAIGGAFAGNRLAKFGSGRKPPKPPVPKAPVAADIPRPVEPGPVPSIASADLRPAVAKNVTTFKPKKPGIPKIGQTQNIASVTTKDGRQYDVTAEVFKDRDAVVMSPSYPSNIADDLADAMKHQQSSIRAEARGMKLANDAPRAPDWAAQNPKEWGDVQRQVGTRFLGMVNSTPGPHILALVDGIDINSLGSMIQDALPKGKVLLKSPANGELAVVDRGAMPEQFQRWDSYNPRYGQSIGQLPQPAEWASAKPAATSATSSVTPLKPAPKPPTRNSAGIGAAGGMALGGTFAPDANGDGVVDAQERANGALGGAFSGGIGGAVAGRALGAFGRGANKLARGPERAGNRMNQQTFGGVNAKTADRAALGRAQNMEAEGASRDDIWDATGWFKGVDGKWRFEIDDSRSTFNESINGQADYLRHPDGMFKAYRDVPGMQDLGDVRVMRSGRPDEGAFMGSGTPIESLHIGKGSSDPRSVALHEYQHGIQAREGFARGGSMSGVLEDAATRDVAFAEALDMLRPKSFEEYAQRWDIPDTPRARADHSQLVERQKEAMAAMEQLAAKTDWTGTNEIPTALREAAFKAYRRLAGEVEARNVQTRRDFTPEERRAKRPWETQDVPDDQQIVRFGSGKAESRPKPPPANRLAVPKQLAASLNKSKVSPPLREKLNANAALPPGERKSIMEATGWDNEILRIAAPFIREGTRMDTEIGAKVAALVKQASANPVEYALRQTMAKGAYEEAQKRFKQASGARSRAATNLENLRTRNMLNPNQPAVKQQLSVHKQRRDDAEQFLSEAARLRDEAKVLLDRADIEMMSLEQVRDYAKNEIQRITDALGANRPNTKGTAMLPAYNPMGKGKPGPINPAGAKPNKQAAEELAHMLFEADQAELFAKLQAGDITPQNRKALGMAASYYARHPGMAVLTAAGAAVTGAGAVSIYADQKKRSEDVREVARQRQAEPERPGFKWDWDTQSKKRDFVVTLQSALNDLGYEIGSVDGSMIRADGKQTKTQKALEHFLWSLDNTRVPGSPVTEDDWKAIEREALAARRKRA